MHLKFSGAPEITAPRDLVWERLMDPHFVARSAPGVERVEIVHECYFKVISGFGIGAMKLRFTLDVELSEVIPPSGLSMRTRGKAPGSAVDVRATLQLEEIDEGRTRLTWYADTEVSGTVASVGARLLEGTARKLTEQFWVDFAANASAPGLETREAPGSAPLTPGTTHPPDSKASVTPAPPAGTPPPPTDPAGQ
jgi:carbon monoxide dehydrogenase subunit G